MRSTSDNSVAVAMLVFFSRFIVFLLLFETHRKRRRGSDSEEGQQLNPHAKRSGGGHDLIVSDLGRDVWDSEVSPEYGSGPILGSLDQCSPFTSFYSVPHLYIRLLIHCPFYSKSSIYVKVEPSS